MVGKRVLRGSGNLMAVDIPTNILAIFCDFFKTRIPIVVKPEYDKRYLKNADGLKVIQTELWYNILRIRWE